MYLDKRFITSPAFIPVKHQHYIEIDDNGNANLYDVTQGPDHRHRFNGEKFESDGTHEHLLTDFTKEFIDQLKIKRKKS
jgi:hypothetical protein